MGLRFAAIISIFGAFYAFLLFNLYNLQILNGERYRAKAESQYFSAAYLRAQRGSIYFTDKNGNSLSAAASKEFPIIYAVPKEVEDVKEFSSALSEAIGQPATEIEAKLSQKGDLYKLLVRKADPDVTQKVSDLNLKGAYVENQLERFYPLGPLASQLLGFVAPSANDESDKGRYGLEKFYEDVLAGVSGAETNGKITPAESGENIKLTIDPNIQEESRKILERLVRDFKATGGSIIVEEPKTGKILTLENYPSFNPNNYSQFDVASFSNPASQSVYEPGSVFKVITMAAGLDANKITPDTTYVDTGKLTLNGKTIKNWDLKAHGKITMTNVIEQSVNTGAAFAESKIGRNLFKKYLEEFGFGEKTGIDLPNEVSGNLGQLSPKAPEIAFATASFGQGVSVTTLELINAVSAIANGGELMRPYLNSALEPVVVRRVISARAAKDITGMMVSALDKAEVGKIKNYTLAGKTGTAQVPDFNKGGYTDKVINTYVGFGPTTDPKFIILIKLNEPEGAPLAGLTVVPAFRELAQFILNYYNIPPDRLVPAAAN